MLVREMAHALNLGSEELQALMYRTQHFRRGCEHCDDK